MDFPRLTFPLTVDFGSAGYWIGDVGPFRYGAAVTAFFCGDDLTDNVGDGLLLMRDLEEILKSFGGHLHPYVREQPVNAEHFLWPEQDAVECSICFAFHPIEGNVGAMVERWTFSCLWDFLYMELVKSIQKGNAPRQCRLCGRWYLHEQGNKTVYCERIAPGETEQTCRAVGARAVFEKKIQEEDTWKIYKRAYKKYYARVMKGNMTREDFNAWAEHAAAERDFIIDRLAVAKSEEEKTRYIEELREDLNRQ